MADENGDRVKYYTVQCGHVEFTIPTRYIDLRFIGSGAFGAVA